MLAGAALQAAVFDFTAPLDDPEAGYSAGLVSYSIFDPIQNQTFRETVPSAPPGVISTNNGVVAWSAGGIVYCRVYDPARTNWMSANLTTGDPLTFLNQRGIVTWTTGTAVHAQVYEPALGEWVGTRVTSGQTYNLKNERGVISWSSGGLVYFLVYDPARREWMADAVASGATYDLSNQDGVVAWSSSGIIYYAVYDPLLGQWMKGHAGTGTTSSLQNHGGVVAWISSNVVYCRVYDPVLHVWQPEYVVSGFPTNLAINNDGAVTWSISGANLIRGYDALARAWTNSATPPLACFAVSTNAGPAPLPVRFIDMSVGGSSWLWNFGDGGAAAKRAPTHFYARAGGFIASLQVSNSRGQATFATNILTDVVCPVGSVVINDGAELTTNRVVTLTLSATDDSGSVPEMRVRNAGEEWPEWQPYATTLEWTLTEGNGLKTVEAQFRDPDGNESEVVSDTITLDDTPLPTVNFAFNATNVLESVGTFTIPLTLDHPFRDTVTVRCVTSGGTAVPGVDYTPLDAEVVFYQGFTIAQTQLTILANQDSQPSRTVELTLIDPVNAVPGDPLVVTILDDDPVGVHFQNAEYTVAEGGGQATITVTLENPSGLEVTVDYQTTDTGTAVPGEDFQPVSGRLTFPPNTTTASFTVPVLDNNLAQGDRTVGLALANPVNATLQPPSEAVLTIQDNDPPVVNFAQAEYTFAAPAGSATINVTLSKPATGTILVDYASVEGGSAVPGEDYVAVSDTLVFSPGETSRGFVITVLANPDRDGPRTIWLRLNNALDAVLGPVSSAVLRLQEPVIPTVENPRYLSDGRFSMDIVSAPGSTVQVQASQNFVVWHLFDVLTNETGRITWTEAAPGGLEYRFYRVRLLP
jgi:PKD repeat protein